MTRGRIVAIAVCALAAVPFLLGLWVVLGSVLPAGADPHGYALIVGTMLCLLAGMVLLAALPSALAGRAARVANRVAVLAIGLVAVGLVVVLLW